MLVGCLWLGEPSSKTMGPGARTLAEAAPSASPATGGAWPFAPRT